MIRITTATKRNGVTITVDGEVIDEYLETIDTVVKQASGQGGTVHLFLRDVSCIDQGGLDLLRQLRAKGVRWSATGILHRFNFRNPPIRGAAHCGLGRRQLELV